MALELTRRELEVARLVAEGLTNRAIAERLFLSERTVDGHVEHALNKLGFGSRSELAAWVGRAPPAQREIAWREPLTRFFGRATEVNTVVQLLARHRLVTLVGPGGVGKTRLALSAAAAATRFRRLRLADLAPISAAERVPAELELALRPPLDASTLLLVDNCEHVVEAAATSVDHVLRSTPVHVLATSREPLRIETEAVVQVAPLEEPDAVELFLDRMRPGAATRAEAALVCRRLDHLPLALELAAARTLVMPASALAESLEHALSVLTVGLRTAPERHRRLDASIAWSYRLLADNERAVLRALAVFEGSFTLDAGVSVAATAPEVVLDLVERSLVAADADGRYRLLFPVREFGRRELDSAERAAAEARHDAWLVRLAERLRPSSTHGLVERSELWAERALVWPALDRLEASDPDRFLSLAVALRSASTWRMPPEDHDRLLRRALRHDRPDHPDHARLHLLAASTAGMIGDFDRQERHAAVLAGLADAAGDLVLRAEGLLMLGMLETRAGDARRAIQLSQAAAEAAADGDEWTRCNALNNWGMLLWRAGEFAEGEVRARQALALAAPGHFARWGCLDTLARNLAGLGRLEEALTAEREAAALVARDRMQGVVASVLDVLARFEAAAGDEEWAAVLLGAGARFGEETGTPVLDPVWPQAEAAAIMARHPEHSARGRALDAWQALHVAGDRGPASKETGPAGVGVSLTE